MGVYSIIHKKYGQKEHKVFTEKSLRDCIANEKTKALVLRYTTSGCNTVNKINNGFQSNAAVISNISNINNYSNIANRLIYVADSKSLYATDTSGNVTQISADMIHSKYDNSLETLNYVLEIHQKNFDVIFKKYHDI